MATGALASNVYITFTLDIKSVLHGRPTIHTIFILHVQPTLHIISISAWTAYTLTSTLHITTILYKHPTLRLPSALTQFYTNSLLSILSPFLYERPIPHRYSLHYCFVMWPSNVTFTLNNNSVLHGRLTLSIIFILHINLLSKLSPFQHG